MSKILECPHCGETIYLPLPDDATASPQLRKGGMPEIDDMRDSEEKQ